MDGSAVKAIQELALKSNVIDFEGTKFVPQNYQELRFKVDRPQCLQFNTLKSLVEFVKGNPNDIEFAGAIVVINKDLSVDLYSDMDETDTQRTLLATSSIDIGSFPFDRFLPSEAFNIYLQTRFIYDESAMDLFKTTSRLRIDEGVTLSDDGMSAKVTVQRGVSAASAEAANVPTRVLLKPFRIFPECDQPASQFIVRLREGEEKTAQIGLWETDGGFWRVDAKQIIQRKLEEYGLSLPVYA